MEERDPKERITHALAVIIIGAWLIAFARTHFDSDYTVPNELTTLMVSVTTWAFVGGVVKEVRRSIDDGKRDEEVKK